jgi:dCTP deaminase
MILSDWEIRALCEGSNMVEGYDPALLNPASLDVRLGDRLMVEQRWTCQLRPVDISWATPDHPFWLRPGCFALGQTIELFNLPTHIAAAFALKSSRARTGLEHLLAGYCDPGWHGSVLTLELHNSRQLHALPLWPGLRIGQMVFHRMSGQPLRSYAETGRYNGDRQVQESRG